jgi:hypothetical protein
MNRYVIVRGKGFDDTDGRARIALLRDVDAEELRSDAEELALMYFDPGDIVEFWGCMAVSSEKALSLNPPRKPQIITVGD